MSAPRVLVVDDSAFMRSRIHREITSAGMEVAGEARSGQEGVEMYRSLRPDLVTMDLTMRGDDGLTATRGILAIDPDARVVLFSIVDDPEMVRQALAAGIKAYVHKSRPSDLIEKLKALAGVAA
ncbi:MAG: response regulator [Thermoanaerobaculia bacterium]|nr:Chemotaxis protein CheY [Thermoanaerobaculia bacterium]MCK6683523.1 response regulator [Thermoanaerobaculia bacterium]